MYIYLISALITGIFLYFSEFFYKRKKEKGSADQRYIKYQKGLQILFLYSRFNSNLILSSEGFTLSSKYFIFIFITHGISNIHTMISNTL